MKILKHLNELQKGQYIEIFPGAYSKKAWNEESVYIKEGIFKKLEGIIQLHFKNFNHFNINNIDHETWEKIIKDFKVLSEFSINKDLELNELLMDLIPWLEKSTRESEVISVIGI